MSHQTQKRDVLNLIRAVNPVVDPDQMPDASESMVDEIIGMTAQTNHSRPARQGVSRPALVRAVRIAVIAAVVLIPIAVVSAVKIGDMLEGQVDRSEPMVDESSYAAVIEVSVEAAEEPILLGTSAWSGTATDTLYERGPYPQVDGSILDLDVPKPGDSIRFATWDTTQLGVDRTYVVALTQRFGNEGAWEWFAHVVIQEDGSTPPGLPASIVNDLEVAAVEGEDTLDTLIGLARELEAYGRAAVVHSNAAETGRLAVLRSARSDVGPDAAELAAAWAAQEPNLRQLPLDLDTVPDAARRAVGIDDSWRWWTVEVTFQPETIGVDWVGLYFPEVGYIGPSMIDRAESSDGITTVMGWGPVGVEPVLLTWSGGFPRETAPGAPPDDSMLVPADQHTLTLPDNQASLAEVLDGGAVRIELSDAGRPEWIELLDQAEYREFLPNYLGVTP